MSKQELTQELIRGLTCPPDKRKHVLCDTVLPGLNVEVRANSSTYWLQCKVAGITRHERLGRTDELTLAEARKRAQKRKAELQLAKDGPEAGRPATTRPAAMTLTEFFEQHYLPHVKPRKRSWKRDEELFRLRMKGAFGSKRLTELTRKEMQRFHTGILDQGLSPATADHHIKVLRHALNLAVEWQLLDKNPLTGLKLFNVDNRTERYLDAAQLERLLHVLRTDPRRPVCRIAMFLLSTGCRLNEALRAKWNQVDRQNRVWRIPASNSKSKRVRSVPLNDSALEVLAELDTEGTFEYLFVNHRTGKPYVNITKVWSKLRKKAGLEHVRIHDLRHQYASFLVNGGRSLYEVQAILGHSDPSVTQRYAHLSSASLQAAANSASVAIKGAGGQAAP